MATQIEDIYSRFSTKYLDYNLLKYTDEEIERDYDRLLNSAISRFYTCEKLSTLNMLTRQFEETLSFQEIEILSEFMVLGWIERQVQDITKFKDRLASKDYQTFSRANMLSTLLKVKEDKQSEIDNLLSEYGTQISFLRMKKILNKT